MELDDSEVARTIIRLRMHYNDSRVSPIGEGMEDPFTIHAQYRYIRKGCNTYVATATVSSFQLS